MKFNKVNGKDPRNQSLHDEDISLDFIEAVHHINCNERSYTTDASMRMSGTLIFKCKQHSIHDPRGPEKYNNDVAAYGAII